MEKIVWELVKGKYVKNQLEPKNQLEQLKNDLTIFLANFNKKKEITDLLISVLSSSCPSIYGLVIIFSTVSMAYLRRQDLLLK